MSDLIRLSRDPFARTQIIRMTEITNKTCSWCGNKRMKKGKILNKLFYYGIEHDSGHTFWDRIPFCSIGCRNSYRS